MQNIKVKLITWSEEPFFEKQVNEFIEKNEIVDIKFSMGTGYKYFAALIIYKKNLGD